MKLRNKSLFMAILSLLVVITLVSCSKDEKLIYSCNPKINKWVIENLDVIKNASRGQLSELPLPFQKASYMALSPERKFELWNEKLELIKGKWDEPVRVMIEDLQSNMIIDWFNDTLNAVDYPYLESWEKQMLTLYMDTTDYAICFTQLATEEELERVALHSDQFSYSWVKNSSLVNDYNKTRDVPGGGDKLNCVCNWDITCGLMNAGLCIESNNCEHVVNCGLLCQYPCRGECEYHMVVVDDNEY